MVGRIRVEDITAVRERARIEEIVGAHVTLRSAGVGSMKGLCPFHDERTPSFHVRPQLGLYHCFGCGEGGDVIDFVMKIDHLAFAEAVEHLAARAGVQLRYEEDGSGGRKGPDPGKRQRLLEAHGLAAAFYEEQLVSPEAAVARRFLAERGFDRAAAAQFGVGYAPKGWDNLARHLRNRTFTEAELLAGGLVSQGNRGSYDRFRGRLMWPIRDTTGSVIGFGARRLYDDDPGPKYLNTPETPLYKKAQVLYGIDVAKREIARRKQLVVVEGYTDVMAMHLAGVPTAVATCGTAFGADHIRVARRLLGDAATSASGIMLATGGSFGGEVIFTFDGDEAGQKAALRAFEEDQRFAAQTFVSVESHGMDPCDLRQHAGDEALRELVATRTPLFEFAITSVMSRVDLETAEGRVTALRAGAPVVARIRDVALRSEYARVLAGELGMDENVVRRAVQSAGRAGGGGDHEVARPVAGRGYAGPAGLDDPVVRLERQVLEVVLQLPDHAMAAGFDELAPETFTVPAHRAVLDAIRAAGGVSAYGGLVEQLSVAGAGAGAAQQAMAQWAGQVLEGAGPVAPLITELAVSPLPQDQPEHVGEWAGGVLTALVRLGLNRQIGDLKARLQRTPPTDPGYQQLFADLLTLEERRRSLQG
ncbi:DNA primase [Pseudactinotalea sp. HY158]|uniref:DNA primase n=1 Tax=Pseudactinotalea sp. HY158 TaxID=2654547 RepID=UPI00129D13EC|nr:DNA primase [Pseudactinotalea sp. HY158]QGH69533.1 DNA primase [Pseudactinotalea sp. HY158]